MIGTLGFVRDSAIEKMLAKDRKRFTVRFEASVNAKSLTVIKKASTGFSDEFKKVHDKDKKACRMKVDLLMTGPYTLIDFSKYSGKLHELRAALEKLGMPIDGFIYRYEKAAEGKKDEWIFEITFYDVDPTDTNGLLEWEAGR